MRRVALAAVTTVVAACASWAPREAVPGLTGRSFGTWTAERHRDGDWLSPAVLAQSSSALPAFRTAIRMQILATQESMLGEYAAANRDFGDGARARYAVSTSDAAALVGAVEPQAAVDGFCKAVRGRKLVVVSEEHHLPVGRVFGESVLSCLRADGFDTLALEALGGEAPDAIATRGHVARGLDGPYLDEPRMAAMVERAIARGFTLVKYDASPPCDGCSGEERISKREDAQATALASYLAAHPSARMVVWCGYDHVYKRPRPTGIDWMASRLWQKTGIEPYSVRQMASRAGYWGEMDTWHALDAGVTREGPLFVEVGAGWTKIPEVFRRELDGRDGGPAVDAVVVHRRRAETDSRAAWLGRPADESHALSLTCVSTPASKPHPNGVVVQLFPDLAHAADGVPADQTRCNCTDLCELVAPAGDWHAVVRSEREVLLERSLTLAPAAPVVLAIER